MKETLETKGLDVGMLAEVAKSEVCLTNKVNIL